MFIPNFMNYSNITSIKKRKSKKLNIDNMRAIFSLIIFKKISDNLLLNDLYKDIDENMTNANIGGRRERQAKDHLFILYGIIDSVIKDTDEDDIDILIFDIEKAYDKLFLEECLNDLVDTVPDAKANDKVSLLYK